MGMCKKAQEREPLGVRRHCCHQPRGGEDLDVIGKRKSPLRGFGSQGAQLNPTVANGKLDNRCCQAAWAILAFWVSTTALRRAAAARKPRNSIACPLRSQVVKVGCVTCLIWAWRLKL